MELVIVVVSSNDAVNRLMIMLIALMILLLVFICRFKDCNAIGISLFLLKLISAQLMSLLIYMHYVCLLDFRNGGGMTRW